MLSNLIKKRIIANALWEKGITVIYAEDEINTIFIAIETEDEKEVEQLVRAEGFGLTETPRKGEFATSSWLKKGYWCLLQ